MMLVGYELNVYESKSVGYCVLSILVDFDDVQSLCGWCFVFQAVKTRKVKIIVSVLVRFVFLSQMCKIIYVS